MSDLDLSTALTDLASEVTIVDLAARVNRRITVRRRRRGVATVVGTVVAVLVVVGGAIAVATRGGGGPRPSHHPTPRPSPSVKPLSLTQRLPRYVPPEAHLTYAGQHPSHYPTAAVYQEAWRLNNRAHIRFSIIDDRTLKPCPRLDNPRVIDKIKMPCGSDNHWLYTFSPLADGYPQSINGHTAHVADEQPAGIQDVEWREGPFHYLLVSDRRTPGGGPLNGLPFAEIVRMARSVRSDPSIPKMRPLPNPPGVSIPSTALDGFTYRDREPLNTDGAVVSYQRGIALFDIYVEPGAFYRRGTDSVEGEPELFPRHHRHNVTISHIQIDGRHAVTWTEPGDVAGMRLRLGRYSIGFYGRYGATTANYKRIAKAMRVIPHQP